MIRYHPINSGVPWHDADKADLSGFDWQKRVAEFIMYDDNRLVRVSFSEPVIVRMLDEFTLSTESNSELWEGLIPYHFAYRVEGDPFFDAQSEIWREVHSGAKHYRFLTGAGCLDVVTACSPNFQTVAL